MNGKIRIRLRADTRKELEHLRLKLLRNNPQMILSQPYQSHNIAHDRGAKWVCFGDYTINKVRRRRGNQ